MLLKGYYKTQLLLTIKIQSDHNFERLLTDFMTNRYIAFLYFMYKCQWLTNLAITMRIATIYSSILLQYVPSQAQECCPQKFLNPKLFVAYYKN